MRKRLILVAVLLAIGALWTGLMYLMPHAQTPSAAIQRPAEPVPAPFGLVDLPNTIAKTEIAKALATETRADIPQDKELGCALRGVVLQADGRPASGASVSYSWSPSKQQAQESAQPGEGIGNTATAVLAGVDGHFSFTGLPRGSVVVTAKHDSGCAIGRAHLNAGRPVEELFLILAGGESLGGAVVTRRGAAIPGARVVPLEHSGRMGFPHLIEARAVTTDGEGRFYLSWLAPGAWKLLVSADGFGAVITEEIPTGSNTTRIVLDTGAELVCHVVLADSGRPMPGIVVTLSHMGTEIGRFQAVSDAAGEARLSPVGKGAHSLGIEDNRYTLADIPAPIDVDPARRQPPVTLRLIDGGRIRGRVVDGNTGAGIPGVVVWASHKSRGVYFSSATDVDGAYFATGLPPGDYRVHIRERIPAYPQDPSPPLEHRVTLAAGSELKEVDFILTPGASLAGVVVDTEGNPVPDATVRARNAEGPQVLAEFYTAADGRFSFGDYSEGEAVNLSAETLEQKSGFRGPFLAGSPGSDSIELVLGLTCSGIIAGRVIDPGGDPVSCQVEAHAEEPELGFPVMAPIAKTDFQGNFVLAGVCTGTYVLRVLPPGKNPRDLQTVRIAPGQAATGLELVYDPGELFDLSGVVVDEEGLPVAGARVRASVLNSAPLGLMPSVRTDDAGVFYLEGLPVGLYAIHIVAEGYGEEFITVDGANAGEVAITLTSARVVRGQVTDSQGRSVSEFTVSIWTAGDSVPVYSRVSNTQGAFSVMLPHDGLWILRVEAAGFDPVELDLGRCDSNASMGEIAVTLPRATAHGVDESLHPVN